MLATIAANREFRGRGLLARFLCSYPRSMVGSRGIGTPVPETTAAAYTKAVYTLAETMAKWPGGTIVLTLTDAARAALQGMEENVEPTLAGDGELASLADWGAKYVGAIARIVGILHLVQHGTAGARKEVTAGTVQAAIRIGEYFKACAINAFTEMGGDLVPADALYLVERIRRLGQDEVSLRDMFSAVRGSRFKKVPDVMPAVNLLVDHIYLARISEPSSGRGRGRTPSPRFRVNRRLTENA